MNTFNKNPRILKITSISSCLNISSLKYFTLIQDWVVSMNWVLFKCMNIKTLLNFIYKLKSKAFLMQLQTLPPIFYHFSSPHCSISVCSLACEKSTSLHLPHYPMWTFTCLLRPVQNASVKHFISVNVPFSMISTFKKTKTLLLSG